MRKVSLVSISLFTLVGIASAQTPTPPAKGAPAAPAEKKAPPPAADKAAPPAAEKMVPPKPPAVPTELVDAGKQWGGTWRCTGQSMIGEQMMDTKATVTHTPDATLNKFWLKTTFTGTAAKLPPMKSTWFTTYDPNAKKLYRMMVNARGGHSTSWGTIADKKITWEGEAHWATGTDVKTRTTEELISAKELKVSGEASKDGGKTWSKEFEATCKK